MESLLYPRAFTQAVAEVLFNHFKVPKVHIFLKNTLPIYTLSVESGLVIDMGHLMTEISPVIYGQFSKVGVEQCHQAGGEIERALREMIYEDNEFEAEDDKSKVTFDIVEQIKVKYCKVLGMKQAQQLSEYLEDEGKRQQLLDKKYDVEVGNLKLKISYRT